MHFKVCEPMFAARTSMNHGVANTPYTWFALQVECWREIFAGRGAPKFECHVDKISLERDGTVAINFLHTCR
jgi:hypothetical protein